MVRLSRALDTRYPATRKHPASQANLSQAQRDRPLKVDWAVLISVSAKRHTTLALSA